MAAENRPIFSANTLLARLVSGIGAVGSSEEEDSTIIGAVLGPAFWKNTRDGSL